MIRMSKSHQSYLLASTTSCAATASVTNSDKRAIAWRSPWERRWFHNEIKRNDIYRLNWYFSDFYWSSPISLRPAMPRGWVDRKLTNHRSDSILMYLWINKWMFRCCETNFYKWNSLQITIGNVFHSPDARASQKNIFSSSRFSLLTKTFNAPALLNGHASSNFFFRVHVCCSFLLLCISLSLSFMRMINWLRSFKFYVHVTIEDEKQLLCTMIRLMSRWPEKIGFVTGSDDEQSACGRNVEMRDCDWIVRQSFDVMVMK